MRSEPRSALVVVVAFVYRSGCGLPLASVSYGTLAGKLVPRKRRYCERCTCGIRRFMRMKSPASGFQFASLNTLSTRAEVFFAAAGTFARFALEIQSRGHSPA